MILLSNPRREGVAVLLVLPPDGRLVLHYDDGTEQDITPIAADLLVSYLLGAGGETAGETEHLCDVMLRGGDIAEVRFATVDLRSSQVGEVPAERLLPLLGAALAAAVEEGERERAERES